MSEQSPVGTEKRYDIEYRNTLHPVYHEDQWYSTGTFKRGGGTPFKEQAEDLRNQFAKMDIDHDVEYRVVEYTIVTFKQVLG